MGLAVILRSVFVDREVKRDTDPTVFGTSTIQQYPMVLNIPPAIAILGQEYVYELSVVDSDTHPANISGKITQGPSWLFMNGLRMSGYPDASSIGTHKVEYEITDGDHTTFKSFYLIVATPDETQ